MDLVCILIIVVLVVLIFMNLSDSSSKENFLLYPPYWNYPTRTWKSYPTWPVWGSSRWRGRGGRRSRRYRF